MSSFPVHNSQIRLSFDSFSLYKLLRWLTECNCDSAMWLHCQLRDREGGKNQQGWESRGGKTRISGQQHPRSLAGRQTLMLKFRSHTRLQTMLLTREGKDERQRGSVSVGGGGQHTEEEAEHRCTHMPHTCNVIRQRWTDEPASESFMFSWIHID